LVMQGLIRSGLSLALFAAALALVVVPAYAAPPLPPITPIPPPAILTLTGLASLGAYHLRRSRRR